MGRSKRKYEESKIEDKLEFLIQENRSLRKKLNRLKKLVEKSETYILDSFDEAEEELVEEKKRANKHPCSNCGEDTKSIKIRDMIFIVCPRCKHREKIKK